MLNTAIYKDFETTELPSNFVNMSIINTSTYVSTATLEPHICDSLVAMFNTFGSNDFYDVGVNGYLDDQAPDGKGSKRITNYDIKFANYLNHILSGKLPSVINLNDYSPVDWQSQNPEKYNVWAFEGVSPVFRYMEYTQGSEHFPHYDAPFISKENPLVRTLMSGVLYLTTNKSGATGFIIDGQNEVLFEDRDTSDWSRQATLDEVESWELPVKGKLLIFPHQVCHTVFPLLEDEKRIIIRFDIFFRALT